MKKCLTLAIAVACCVSATALRADITDNSGAGFTIPDLVGGVPGQDSSSIVIGANEIISDVEVTLFGASHTWIGDLNVTISNGSTTADLLIRTGRTGGTGSGDSSNIGADYTFSDDGGDFWAAAAGAGGDDVIAGGDYFATTTDGAPVSLASLFAGQSTAGTWTLTISDNAGGDTGAINGWGITLTSTAIPEPGMIGLLSVAGLGLVARRRR